ncbi:vab2p [Saccharomyces arboricola H-6]|uniref:Vab2p n=1 Tax=Saccharomyces arboricola (strain H-6 / AS 2.3317 / CBS 10644) TaxID=1160507 RepID=J8PPN3_SACAR|nr:vab2p [Saccharomyces arboricola H-6]
MVADLTKGILKWKSRMKFDAIANCPYYDDLKALPPLASHKKLTQAAIFNTTKYELLQVREDIVSIYEVVNKDTNEERNQMQQIELQLKKSLKKVERNYKSVLKQRASTSGVNGNDCLLINTEKKIDLLNGELTLVDSIVEDIVNSFIALDANLPKKAQLLKSDSINEAHYPLLFAFLYKACPEAIVPVTEASDQGDDLGASLLEHNELPRGSINSSDTRSELQNDSSVPLLNGDAMPRFQKFLPPTFNKRSGPSIETNFENVSADGLMCTKYSLRDSISLT